MLRGSDGSVSPDILFFRYFFYFTVINDELLSKKFFINICNYFYRDNIKFVRIWIIQLGNEILEDVIT